MIMNRPATRLLLLFAVLAMLIGLYSSCRELDVPYFSDEDNIMAYIEQAEDGREFFRTKGLYSDSPYTIYGDTAIYRLIVDSVHRSPELSIVQRGGQLKDYRIGTDPLRDAEVVIDDIFYGRLFRMAGTETTHVDRTWGFTRRGLFLKLGADDHDFLGWKLWAYNGGLDIIGTPVNLLFTRSNGTYFSYLPPGGEKQKWYIPRPSDGSLYDTSTHFTHENYTRLDQFPVIGKGEVLSLQGRVPDRTTQLLLNGMLQSGYDVQQIRQPTADYFIDSVRTAAVNLRNWNMFTMTQKKTFVQNNVTIVSYIYWCVPYRVAQ